MALRKRLRSRRPPLRRPRTVIRPASRHSTISARLTPPNSPTWSPGSAEHRASSTHRRAARRRSLPSARMDRMTASCADSRCFPAATPSCGNLEPTQHECRRRLPRSTARLSRTQVEPAAIVAACDADFEGPRTLRSAAPSGRPKSATTTAAPTRWRAACTNTSAGSQRSRRRASGCRPTLSSSSTLGQRSCWIAHRGDARRAQGARGLRQRQQSAPGGRPPWGDGLSQLARQARPMPPCRRGADMKFSRELFTRHRPKLEALLVGYWASAAPRQ